MSGVTIRLALFCLFTFAGLVSAHIGPAPPEYPSEKPSANSGQDIYKHNCTGCHGEDGKGGAIGGIIDFTNQDKMKNKNSSIFFEAVSEGVAGTTMPAFNSFSKPQRWDVIAYIWTFWADLQSVERGKIIFEKNCASCHGIKGDGSGLPGAMDFTNLSNMISIGQPSVFFDSVSNGVPGTAMPPFKDTFSEEERWDAIKYIWTFQYGDYPGSPAGSPPDRTLPSPDVPSSGYEWYKRPTGYAILAVSGWIVVGIVYLFIRGLRER